MRRDRVDRIVACAILGALAALITGVLLVVGALVVQAFSTTGLLIALGVGIAAAAAGWMKGA